MAGNSWLGISQYWAAMEQPPHLKAIAPWEGYSDMYRDKNRRGGVPWVPFQKWVLRGVPGKALPHPYISSLLQLPLLHSWVRN